MRLGCETFDKAVDRVFFYIYCFESPSRDCYKFKFLKQKRPVWFYLRLMNIHNKYKFSGM